MEETLAEMGGRIHHGRNITRTRKVKGIKQSALASALSMSQQAVSRLEQKARIEDKMLGRIAEALEISVDVLREMEEDPMTIIIENNDFRDNAQNNGYVNSMTVDVKNDINKIIELEKENQQLYERLLEAEKQKNEYLEKLVKQYEENKGKQ